MKLRQLTKQGLVNMVLWIFGKRKRIFDDLRTKRITLALRRLQSATATIGTLIGNIDKHIVFLEDRIKVLKKRAQDMEKAGKFRDSWFIKGEVKEHFEIIKRLVVTRNILEKIQLRLLTIKDMSEALLILAPALKVLDKIVKDLSKIKPEIAYQLENIRELIYTSLLDLGEFTKVTIDYYVSTTTEAEEILEEAKIVAEKKLRKSF